MVKYIFKLRRSYIPDLTRGKSNKFVYGGACLEYAIYRAFYVKLGKKEVVLFRHKKGYKTFLRPYKKFWDKRTSRLPYVYWGKKSHPLTRLWVVLPEFPAIDTTRIVPELSLIHQHVKLFGRNFKVKDITVGLFRRKDKFVVYSNY